MSLVSLHDRTVIETWLRRDPRVHLYELGDLDDFFFAHTTWYALEERGAIAAIGLVYTASPLPVVVALGREEDVTRTRRLVTELRGVLPRRFYAHFAVGCTDALGSDFIARPHGVHDRMIMTRPSDLDEVGTGEAVALGANDAAELETFYASAYPENWFDRRMLETGLYRAVRRDGRIVSAAGVHVFSRRYRVAALGNIATNAAFRGRGLGRVVCAALCKDLRGVADPVGLNVLASNTAAVSLYRQLGFERALSYEETLFETR